MARPFYSFLMNTEEFTWYAAMEELTTRVLNATVSVKKFFDKRESIYTNQNSLYPLKRILLQSTSIL